MDADTGKTSTVLDYGTEPRIHLFGEGAATYMHFNSRKFHLITSKHVNRARLVLYAGMQ
jgi:hypothetical protein